MNVLLKSATIIDPLSVFNSKMQDVLIENGKIIKIADHISGVKNSKVVKLEYLHISPGWFDSSVSFGEPGYEERETIENGLNVAAKSGFTAIAVNPNTNPVIDNISGISLLQSKAKNHAVNLYPYGTLTNKSNNEDLAELFDMHQAGAKAFCDYKIPISNPNLLKVALQYARGFDGLVCSFPQNKQIAGLGVVNEHINSTKLGLKGNPGLAEELQIARDVLILDYTKGKLHIPTISTVKSVELIRAAKAKKLDISCSVAIHNLCFTDDNLLGFDTNFKVLPPLRTKKDTEALIGGLKDGTIDMVTTDHSPINIEHKKLEFDHAMYGTIGLESAFGALQTLFSTKECVELLTKAKDRFGIKKTTISEGSEANLTLFNPNKKLTFSESHILSKSKNSAFISSELKGLAYGVISNNKIILRNA